MVATYFLRRASRERFLRSEGQIQTSDGSIPSIEERVAANRAWARGEIRSKGRLFMCALWLLALVWNLTFGASFFTQLSNPQIKTGGLIVLGLFALGGLPIIAFAVRETIRVFRYGESLCRVTGKAGVLGERIKGSVSTKMEIDPEGDFTFLLQCLETYHVGTGKNRTSKTEIHWQSTVTVPRHGVSTRSGIPFCFELPKFPPETGYQISRGPISWQLSVRAPTRGVDYSAVFVVPVFKMS
jgi:hypothetical protein